jgi:hypothetical protein
MNKPNNSTVEQRAQERKSRFIKILKNKSGNISSACEAIGIGRTTFYDWCKKDKKFNEEVEAAAESLIDLAESKLVEKINDGNISAITFLLKTKGRKRGYSENADDSNDNYYSQEEVDAIKRAAYKEGCELADKRFNLLLDEYSKYDPTIRRLKSENILS